MLEIVGLIIAMLLAAFVQATTGFGFALMAMPLMTLTLGLDVAAPLVALASVVMNVANTYRLRRSVNWSEFARMSGAALLGILPGFWVQTQVPEGPVRLLLGVVLISYALYSLLQPHTEPLRAGAWPFAAGLLGGVLGAAYNVSGPPVVVYGDLRRWSRDEYRGTLQAFFLVTGTLVVSGHVALGHFDREVGTLMLISVPAILAGAFAGQRLDRYLDPIRFRRLVMVFILLTGAALLL